MFLWKCEGGYCEEITFASIEALNNKLRKKIGIHSKSLTITFLNEFKSHALLYQPHTVHTKQSFLIVLWMILHIHHVLYICIYIYIYIYIYICIQRGKKN